MLLGGVDRHAVEDHRAIEDIRLELVVSDRQIAEAGDAGAAPLVQAVDEQHRLPLVDDVVFDGQVVDANAFRWIVGSLGRQQLDGGVLSRGLVVREDVVAHDEAAGLDVPELRRIAAQVGGVDVVGFDDDVAGDAAGNAAGVQGTRR